MSGDRPSFGGMTVNERLHAVGLTGRFDDAIRGRDHRRAIELLQQVAMSEDDAAMTVDAVLARPATYGHPRPS